MPVGTQATVKSQTVDSLKITGSRVLLANTYHLYLRPGAQVFRQFGGIHRFMNWDGPVLTDSGGFQIFSLPNHRQMNEEGARFQSYLDGKMHLFSPEESIGMQKAIGSDIMMVLDQCIPSTAEYPEALAAMGLTHRWAKRSLQARGDSPQALFGIVQGACFEELRRQSADFLTQMPFDGFAIGGLAVGETKSQREDFTELTAALLPRELPRYLMGVGTPIDILEAVHRGVDMFDCIIPSQIAQRGGVYTSTGRLQLRRTIYKYADEPLDPDCTCATCKSYSRAYLHHLHKAEENLGWTLVTQHNLTFYHRLMREIRESILAGSFLSYYQKRREELAISDNTHLSAPPPARPRKQESLQLGDYEIHASEKGFHSVRQISSGEIMHSVSEPSDEARRLYVEQPKLKEKLTDARLSEIPLVIWDVGLGAATNAMAAIDCFQSLVASGESVRPLQLVSFEIDLDPLRLACKHPVKFPHLCQGAPHRILRDGTWKSPCGRLTWELLEGDFLQEMEKAAAPDLIYYDPFSSKTDHRLWTPESFSQVFRHCADRATELYTYSTSTAVRAALLCAGFFVGPGAPTGPKLETTRAFTRSVTERDPSLRLLDAEWLQRWNRSDAKYPSSISPQNQPHFENQIRQHPQFYACLS